jgi:hypothetical protein
LQGLGAEAVPEHRDSQLYVAPGRSAPRTLRIEPHALPLITRPNRLFLYPLRDLQQAVPA